MPSNISIWQTKKNEIDKKNQPDPIYLSPEAIGKFNRMTNSFLQNFIEGNNIQKVVIYFT